jgi:hypothetical protein
MYMRHSGKREQAALVHYTESESTIFMAEVANFGARDATNKGNAFRYCD